MMRPYLLCLVCFQLFDQHSPSPLLSLLKTEKTHGRSNDADCWIWQKLVELMTSADLGEGPRGPSSPPTPLSPSLSSTILGYFVRKTLKKRSFGAYTKAPSKKQEHYCLWCKHHVQGSTFDYRKNIYISIVRDRKLSHSTHTLALTAFNSLNHKHSVWRVAKFS